MHALSVSAPSLVVRFTRRPLWPLVDAVVATAFAVPVTAVLVNENEGGWNALLVPLLAALVIGPMATRRRWPAPSLAVAVAGAVMLWWTEPRAVSVALLAVGYSLYTVATSSRLPSALAGLAVAVVAPAVTVLPDLDHRFAALLIAGAYAVVGVIGFGLASHRRQTAALLSRQADIAAAEVERAHAMVTEQRLGIARDLHDVVAHGISTITVQAAYARLVMPADPARAGDAVAAIEAVGRETLTELRQMLHVLRSPAGENHPGPDVPPERTPTPTLVDLGELVARAEHTGLQVDLDAGSSVAGIPAGIAAAAYRTVQEALTNVVKHADTSRVSITMRPGPDRLVVEVVDEGRGCPGETPFGYGLVGMRERALLYGGSFQAGPGPQGGFRVVSTFPLTEPTGS